MQISFFEEFPTTENPSKGRYLCWPTKLYLAASGFKEFNNLKKKIKNKQVQEIIYWPILKKSEGYWISPFADRKALLRIFKELKNQKVSVMLDLELPIIRTVNLYLRNIGHFAANKKLIKRFIDNYSGQIYLVEYYFENKFSEKIFQWLGLHYRSNKVKVIKMMYRSMHKFTDDILKKECYNGYNIYGENFCVGLGTIAVGVNGDEPILSAQQLKRDLKIVKYSGVKESIVFRLGGLNENYVQVISEILK